MRRLRPLGMPIVTVLLLLFSGQGLLVNSGLSADNATWKAGLATAKITPEKPLWMAGYSARTGPADGKLHDLWVKVLALEAPDGRRAVVLTSDILGFPRAMYDRICDDLRTQCGLSRAEILLSASHTHSGPVLRGALLDIYPLDDRQLAMIDEYSTWLEKTVVQTVAAALKEPTAVTLSVGQGETLFAANRRNNRPEAVVEARAAGRMPKGPDDHRVPVLAVRSPEGKLIAAVFGYACHCTTLSINQWSGDYAGFAQIALENNHSGAQMMFVAGCGADQNPLPRRSVELCREYGKMLAGAVDEVLAEPMEPVAPRLATALEFIQLKYGERPTPDYLKAKIARGGYQGRWAKRMLTIIETGEPFETEYRYPVQAWKLGGDYLWISLGGEVVVDYAILFESKYGPNSWVAGYSNDVMAYIPSRRVWEEGGYESGAFSVYGLPAVRWSSDIEEKVTQSVDRLVDRLNSEP